MDEIEKLAADVSSQWASTPLEDLRREALKALNGSAYTAIRPSTNGREGPRLFLVLCVTGEHELSLVEKVFQFTHAGDRRDWGSYTLADMLIETNATDGLAYQDLRSGSKRNAVALCAIGPEKVALLESIFSLPP